MKDYCIENDFAAQRELAELEVGCSGESSKEMLRLAYKTLKEVTQVAIEFGPSEAEKDYYDDYLAAILKIENFLGVSEKARFSAK